MVWRKKPNDVVIVAAGQLCRRRDYSYVTDSFFDKVHSSSPLSLQLIHQQYASQLHLVSLYHLLQQEVSGGRLSLSQHAKNTLALPLDLADDELTLYADNMLYKSIV